MQYVISAALSHSQNGASSRSGSSGEGKRPRRGVGGGVGSTHLFDVAWPALTAHDFDDLEMMITAFGVFDEALAYMSRDGAKPSLLDKDDTIDEGQSSGLLADMYSGDAAPPEFKRDL
jgi:hypothetical protein